MEETKLTHNNCLNKDPLHFFEYHDAVNRRIGLQCKICSFEWLTRVYVKSGNVAEEEIIFEGIKYYLFTNPIYCDPDYRINKNHVELKCSRDFDGKLKRGDHICYKPKTWKGLIIHHAIIEDVKRVDEGTKFDLIHWKQEEGKDRRAIIQEADVDLSSLTDCVMRCEYEEEHPGVNNVQLTLARAKALVGKVGYNLLKDNCEHFATFCKLGSFHSWQVCYALRKAYIALIETLSNAAKLCAAKSAAVVTSASRTAVNMVDDVAGSAVAGGTRSLGVLMQGIGFGIVVVIQGIYFTIDAVKLFKDKRKGKLTDMAFKAYVWKSFISTLERVFYTGGIPAAGSLILSLFNPCTGALIGGMLVAAIVGSALATCTGGFDHTFMGRTMSVCTRPIMLYRSLSVASVNELSPGDHIVIPQWLLHPRCHAIVVRVVSDDDALEVIRFTYEKGVVREKIKFTTPSYKVLYEKGKSFDSETVIKRAKEKIGSTKLVYKILQNNCKSFARWCKTGYLPHSIITIEGYN